MKEGVCEEAPPASVAAPNDGEWSGCERGGPTLGPNDINVGNTTIDDATNKE